jgi:glycosyltransferase involved in cell wall biosynthesis
MKILHVSPLYHPADGGAERHVREVSERLASRGHNIRILTTNARSELELTSGTDASLEPREVIGGVEIARLPASPSLLGRLLDRQFHMRGGYRTQSYLFTPGGVEMLRGHPRNLSLVREVRRFDADVVASWNWLWPAAYQVHLARRWKRFRLVGVPLFHTEQRWTQRPIYEAMLSRCDAFLVNTPYEATYIQSRASDASRFAVQGVGIDPDFFDRRDGQAFRARHALGDAPVVGFVGRMIRDKGLDKILEAMPAVWSWNPEVRLILAGLCSDDGSWLGGLLQGLTPEERQRVLLFPNFSETDKPDLYDSFDVFALPSIADSFGIAFLEAWACRKPVIGSRIGAISCVIDDGRDGLLVDPADPQKLARALIGLLEDPERRARMGEHGYRKTTDQFTWEKVTDRVEALYRELIGDASKTRKNVGRWTG